MKRYNNTNLFAHETIQQYKLITLDSFEMLRTNDDFPGLVSIL